MRRDTQLGGISLIRWQGRRNRRGKSGIAAWTVVLALCALAGAAMMAAQATGWLHWTGLLALVPAGLVLLAISVQLLAVARAALAWLAG